MSDTLTNSNLQVPVSGALIGRKVAIGAVVLAAWVSGTRSAHADGMLLVKDRHVKLFEPSQQAIVGWNGTEEILILRVIVRASHAIDALQVVPFPAEPTVTKGDARAFERIVDLVNNSMDTRRPPSMIDSVPAKPSMRAPVAGKVTMYKEIGLHQITVAHVLSKEGFVDWVKTTMNPSGVEKFDVPAQSIATIADYLASGTQWFVFDQLTLSEKPEQTEPLEYRFKTSRLYYPLKITKVAETSNVELTVLTRQTLNRFVGIEGQRVKRMHPPLFVPVPYISEIDSDLGNLFASSNQVCVRIWQIRDYGGGFFRDLLVL